MGLRDAIKIFELYIIIILFCTINKIAGRSRSRSRSRSPPRARPGRPLRPLSAFVDIGYGGLDAELTIDNFPNMFGTYDPLLVLLGESMKDDESVNVLDFKLDLIRNHLEIKFQHPTKLLDTFLVYTFSMNRSDAHHERSLRVEETSNNRLNGNQGHVVVQSPHRTAVRRIIYKFINKIGVSANKRARAFLRGYLVHGEIPQVENLIAYS